MQEWRSALRLGVVLAALGGAAGPGSPVKAESSDAVLYRIFLNDGATLVSFGEYVRLDDHVVISLPIGSVAADPKLHLVSVPSAAVNWSTTERYADSARYQRYVETRAEADFAEMSTGVARALNEIALTDDAGGRLRMARQARETLQTWPGAHLGYRAADIREIVTMLDEIISEMRIASGITEFDLSFVAIAEPPAPVPLLGPPTMQDTIEQALTAARVTRSPAERISLYQSAVAAIDAGGLALPAEWARTTHEFAAAALADELKAEREYLDFAKGVRARLEERAAAADVKGVEQIAREIEPHDERLGRRRPDVVTSIRLTVEGALDATRRLRLARDQWSLRQAAYQRYARALAGPLQLLDASGLWLDDIKALAGPNAEALVELERQVGRARRALDGVAAPSGLEAVHTNLMNALEFADTAARMRRRAVASGDLGAAWEASSAAAAALMLGPRVREELERALKMPEMR